MYLTLFLSLLALAHAHNATTVNLFVASYDGTLTTLALHGAHEEYTLNITAQSRDCGPDPSWLVYDKTKSILYCLDENAAATSPDDGAVFTSYNVDAQTGKPTLAKSGNLKTSLSVSGVLFNDDKFMAVAGYYGRVSALTLDGTSFAQAQVLNTTVPGSGTNPHQVVLDPTGKFILVPDKGADNVKVFSWDAYASPANILKEQNGLKVAAGTGPRHVAFWQNHQAASNQSDTYLYIVGETSNTVATYKVSYANSSRLDFEFRGRLDTFGGANKTGSAAEIQVSPDNRFLVVSNRADQSFKISRYPTVSYTDQESSDSITTYAIGEDGRLVFKQIWPAGGLGPRHFVINRAGDKVVVGLQNSCRVVVLCRDVATGLIGNSIAHIPLGNCVGRPDGPVMIVWDE